MSIKDLRALTADVLAEAERKREQRRKAAEEEKFQNEVAEEKEHFEAAQNIMKAVLDKAHAAAGKGLHAVEAYEPLQDEFKLVNRPDVYASAFTSGLIGYDSRPLHETEYNLYGPLKVAVKAFIKEGYKVSFFRRSILTSGSFKYYMVLDWN
jgi:hypothetical protein